MTGSGSPGTWTSTTPPSSCRCSTARPQLLGVALRPDGAAEIAGRSRGTPRIANRLLRRVRDYAEVRADGVVTEDIARAALAVYDVDELGLDRLDRAVLDALVRRFGGGPVGRRHPRGRRRRGDRDGRGGRRAVPGARRAARAHAARPGRHPRRLGPPRAERPANAQRAHTVRRVGSAAHLPPTLRSAVVNYLPYVLFAVVILGLLAFSARARRRQAEAAAQRLTDITVGTEVMTTSGLYGVVVAHNDDEPSSCPSRRGSRSNGRSRRCARSTRCRSATAPAERDGSDSAGGSAGRRSGYRRLIGASVILSCGPDERSDAARNIEENVFVAPPPGTLRVGRYFLALGALVAVLYAIVFFGEHPHAEARPRPRGRHPGHLPGQDAQRQRARPSPRWSRPSTSSRNGSTAPASPRPLW